MGAVGENLFNYSRCIVPPRLTMFRCVNATGEKISSIFLVPVANEKKRASLVPVVDPKDKFEGFLVDFTATSGITKEKFAFWQTKTFNLEDRKFVKNNE